MGEDTVGMDSQLLASTFAATAQTLPPDVDAALARAKVPRDAVSFLVLDAQGRAAPRLSPPAPLVLVSFMGTSVWLFASRMPEHVSLRFVVPPTLHAATGNFARGLTASRGCSLGPGCRT